MDEIEWKKNIKRSLKVLSIIFIIFAVLLFGISLLGRIARNDWQDIKNDFLLLGVIGVPIPIFLIVANSIIYIINKFINSEKKVKAFRKNYIREIPGNYAPAIASIIYDLKVDVFKDYTATILYLCTKKYMNMKKENDSYIFELGEEKDYSQLGRCEKYILNIVINNYKFDENEFKKEIVEEAQEKHLITNIKDISTLIRWGLVFTITFILGIIMRKINIILWYIYMIIVPLTIIIYFAVHQEIYITNTKYVRTKKGKELAMTLNGIKNYMKEYTLINEKNLDYMRILEEYIPYALVLNEANAIEEFIKSNEEYRDLIYNIKKR